MCFTSGLVVVVSVQGVYVFVPHEKELHGTVGSGYHVAVCGALF